MVSRIFILLLSLSGMALPAQAAADKTTVHTITLPEVKVALKGGAGQETTAKYCSVCHSLDYITTQPAFSKEKWGEIVNKMIKVHGAPIMNDVARDITAYLGEAYGKPAR